MFRWFLTRIEILWWDRNINLLFFIPFLFGCLLLFLISIVFPEGYKGSIFERILFSLSFFLFGLDGLIIVLKRELPGPSFRGVLAILIGLSILVIFWGVAIRGIYLDIMVFAH